MLRTACVEARVVLQPAGDHGGPERDRRRRVPQRAQRIVGDVLQDHDPRAARRPLGEERRQAAQVRLHQVAQPRGRQLGDVVQRRAQVVERQRDVRGGELAVVVGLLGLDVDQRVLRRGVEVDGQHAFDGGRGVQRRALHLRERAQPERVLQPAPLGQVVGRGEQAPHLGGAPDGTRVRTRGVDAFRVRLGRAAERAERQRRDDVTRGEQPAQVVPGQHGLAERGGVAGDERERVARADRDRVEVAGRPRQLPRERQCDLRELGEVAGADGAARVDVRERADAQRRLQRVQQPRVHAAAAGGELVEADGHHGAHGVVGQRLAGAARVAAQQAQAVVVGRLRVDDGVPVRADPGRAAVDRALGAQLDGQPVARLRPGHGVGSQLRPGAAPGHAHHVGAAEAGPADLDAVGVGHRHPS